MSLVEQTRSIADRLSSQFGTSVADESTRAITRLPGTYFAIAVQATASGELICISADVVQRVDWSCALSDCLLRRHASLGIPTFSRRGDAIGIEARLLWSVDDNDFGAAVRAVADVAGDTIRELEKMGLIDLGCDV